MDAPQFKLLKLIAGKCCATRKPASGPELGVQFSLSRCVRPSHVWKLSDIETVLRNATVNTNGTLCWSDVVYYLNGYRVFLNL
jgi:hypothetical protein